MHRMSGESRSTDPRAAESQCKPGDLLKDQAALRAAGARLVVTAMACLAMLPFEGGCQNKSDETLLDSAESLLRLDMKQGARDVPPENVWIPQYFIPGAERGLRALEKARRGDLTTPAMRSSYLTVQPNGRSAKLSVSFVHRPGGFDVDGVYFLMPDGKSHDFHVIRLDGTTPYPQWDPATWLHWLYFLVVVDDHALTEQEQQFIDGTGTQPVPADEEFFVPGNLRVGLITQDGQRSDAVPVYVEFQNEVDAGRPWGHKNQKRHEVTCSTAR